MNLNWHFIISSLPLYGDAALLTLKLAFWGILFSIAVGILSSLILFFRVKGLVLPVRIYIEVSRNTPLIIQLFFLYYGLSKLGLNLSEQSCAVIGLSFLGGSYMAESFRAGLEAVQKIHIESGLSIGLTKLQLARHIMIPLAFTVSLPSLSANCIFLLKETSVVGAIAIMDLMHVTKDLIGMYYQTFESLLLLVGAYLIMLLPLSLLLSRLERRVRHAEFGI